LEYRYQWKTTIGDPADRKLIINRWNDEFPHKPAPDYYQSYGLGFFEYFQLAEDIGAEPLPILNCGMACQFNSAELAPMNRLDGYIQDALDLVEFANGPVTSTWGKRRADLGHPAPFGMKLLGVGNEQWGPDYLPRFTAFQKALKAKYPEVQLVASADPFTDRQAAKDQSAALRTLNADIIDEHFYRTPEWFFSHASQYDAYPRNGPKILRADDRGPSAPRRRAGEPQRVAGRVVGSRVPHRSRAQRRRGAHVGLRAALRAHRRVAVAAEPDLVRQPALVRDAELLRAAAVRREPRRDRAADHSGREG